jgi:hypothetical protein
VKTAAEEMARLPLHTVEDFVVLELAILRGVQSTSGWSLVCCRDKLNA